MGCLVLMPVYNDWESALLLVAHLDGELQARKLSADILLVDDGSTHPPPEPFLSVRPRSVGRVSRLVLKRNGGHQRAIAIGLTYAASVLKPDEIVVMHADGEDAAADAVRLLETLKIQASPRVVFAARMQRSAGTLFRLFYVIYRLLFRMLTGVGIRFGNFSAVPSALLPRLVVAGGLAKHYAAAILRSGLPYDSIPTARASRLAGRAHMNFGRLVRHGVAAYSVFGDIIGIRLLLVASASLLAALGARGMPRIVAALAGAAFAVSSMLALATRARRRTIDLGEVVGEVKSLA